MDNKVQINLLMKITQGIYKNNFFTLHKSYIWSKYNTITKLIDKIRGYNRT